MKKWLLCNLLHAGTVHAEGLKPLSRKALLTTVTLLNAIAAEAMMGDSKTPKKGYSTPAATGTPSVL